LEPTENNRESNEGHDRNPNVKPTLGRMRRWILSDPCKETDTEFTFEMFRRYGEVINMDLVDQKALWDKLQQNYFKILLSRGEFNFKELGIVRMVYRFYQKNKENKLMVKSIINDSSCKQGLIKFNQICKIYDIEGIDLLV
jgi:hypothetical protein